MGAFWGGVEAMRGPQRTLKESVDGLEEALAIAGVREPLGWTLYLRFIDAAPGPTCGVGDGCAA